MLPHLLPVSTSFQLEPGDNAVALARRHLVGLIAEWEVPLSRDARADLELCASEVMTNARRHAGGVQCVLVVWTGDRVMVGVQDGSRRFPVERRAACDELSGRGLALVDSLSQSWGWTPLELGKLVHFEIAVDTKLETDPRFSALLRVARERPGPIPSASPGPRGERRPLPMTVA
ncbi:ATP-binding protein [Kitasatospora sp. NPDC001574]